LHQAWLPAPITARKNMKAYSTNRLLAILVASLWALTACVASGGGAAPTGVSTASASARRSMAASFRARAEEAYGRKSYLECGQLLREAAALENGDRGLTSYNAACCFAMAGDRDRAFASLGAALDGGYRQGSQIRGDQDLSSLHGDPRWQQAVDRADANLALYLKGTNPELYRLFQEDQADREAAPEKINWAEVTPRDMKRRARVKAILDEGGAKVSADYYHAAMMFQHSESAEEFATAHRLALRACELDPTASEARWLAAAAMDRELMSRGQPQRYGTQFKKVNGRWTLYPVDPSVSDDERARWNVPSLAEAQQRAEAMNPAGPGH
jgi:hypothetical protein